MGFEPRAKPFWAKRHNEREGSTVDVGNWSGRRDSNPRPQPWQGCALPLSYARSELDRMTGRVRRRLLAWA